MTLGNDIHTGIKGIHGVGEALRGSINSTVDRVFDMDTKHDATQQGLVKNQSITDKGKAEMADVDSMIARHEAKRHPAAPNATTGAAGAVAGVDATGAANPVSSTTTAPTNTASSIPNSTASTTTSSTITPLQNQQQPPLGAASTTGNAGVTGTQGAIN